MSINNAEANQGGVREGSPEKTRDPQEKSDATPTNPPREGSPEKTRGK
jgi:hypothetical protein